MALRMILKLNVIRPIYFTQPATTNSIAVVAEDYPRTVLELERRFSSEDACRGSTYLHFAGQLVCPGCKCNVAWRMSRGRFLCAGCRRQVSITAGTVLHDSHLPLTTWFPAIWSVNSQKTGVSALGLQRVLGLGSYKTGWAMLHKLRRTMVRPGRDDSRVRRPYIKSRRMMNLRNKLTRGKEATDMRFGAPWLNPQYLRQGAGNGDKRAPENL